MKKIITLFFTLCYGLFSGQNAIQFNGTNAYITFGNNSNLGLAQFSMECWFKRQGSGTTTSTGTGGVTGVPLITKGRGEADGSNVDMNYFLGIRQTDSTLVADFEEGSSGATPGLNHPIIGVTKLSRNVWYHVAVTYDGSTWKLYLNGQLENQVTVNQPVQNLSIQHSAIASALTSNGTSQGYFNGIIDEVRIWNNARSQSQITSMLNSAITSTATGLVTRWGLDEGAATTVTNSAGGTITGTITGSNWSWVAQQAPFNMNIAPGTPTLVAPADTSKCHRTSMKLSVTVSDPNGDSLWVKFYGRKRNNSKDFSIIPLPDTQYYTSQINGATNALYKAQMNWVVAKRDSLNIKFISGLGDCVENGDNGGNDVEWRRADTSMKIVETNTTVSFPTGIPYGLNVGNHDQSPGGNPNGTTTFFNQYFGVSRFLGRNYWGGNYGSNADNSYQLFTAEGIDFIVINLEYDTGADPAVLAWANGLLQTHSNRLGIVSSHWFLNLNGTFGAQGQATYNALKANPNFFLMLCGHVAGEARRTDVFNGKTVHCVLSDYQARTNGGNGWIRIMKFRPSAGKINVYTYSPSLNQWETDGDSQFILDYDFGPAYTLIDSVKVASGQNASINWNNLLNATDYEWHVKIKDGNSIVTGQSFKFKTGAYHVKLPNDSTLCGGPLNIAPLSGSVSGLSFSWMNGATTQSISVGTSTMVVLNVTDSLNCISKDTMNVTIHTIPLQPGLIIGDFNPCTASAQTYTVPLVNGAANYTWTLPGGWTGTFTNNILVVTTGTNNGNVSVVAGNTCGVSPARSASLSVNSIPAAPGIISGPGGVCIGSGLRTYSVLPVSGADSYVWNLPSGWTGSTSTSVLNATPGSSGGALSVASSNSCGISPSQSLNITVNPLPTLTINSFTNMICAGDNLILNASGATNYTWSTAAGTASVSVAPNTTSNYTVIGTDVNGCSNSAVKTISVNPLPLVTISGNSVICTGDVLNLVASGANTYTWNNAATSASIAVTPSSSAGYTVSATDLNGCMNSAVKSIVVNPLPQVAIMGNNSLCIGNVLTLTATGANTYTWNTLSTSSAIPVSPITNSSYTVSGTDQNGCMGVSIKGVTVNLLPSVSILGNAMVCLGNSLNLTASGAHTYTWNTLATTISISVSPAANTSYTVTGTDLNGCVNTTVKSITVNPNPVVTLIGGTSPVCSGDPVVLTAAGALTYTWSTLANTSVISVTPSASTSYTVSGSDNNGCTNYAVKSITVNPLPNVSIGLSTALICLGETTTLNAMGANTYSWSTGPTSASIIIQPTQTQSYTVTGTGQNGCSKPAVATQSVAECTGVTADHKEHKLFRIYPNPNHGSFNIELGGQGDFSLKIFSATGQHVFSELLHSGINNITQELKAGIYFYVILENGSIENKGKIIIE